MIPKMSTKAATAVATLEIGPDLRVVALEGEYGPSGQPPDDDADHDETERHEHELSLVCQESVRIGGRQVGDADRRLDEKECDGRAEDPGRERQESADPGIVCPNLEDTPVGPETGHQADDAGDRGEERRGRARRHPGSAGSTR